MINISKTIKILLKLIVSLVFFAVLLSFVQGNELVTVFANINWFYFAISFCLSLVMVAASCAKWKAILDLKDNSLSYWELFKIYLVGYFFSNILPSTVGGDVVRSFYAGKLIENQSYSAVSVFVERFSGIFFLFLLVMVAPFFQVHLYSNPYILVPACAGLIFSVITLWIWKADNPFAIPNKISESIFIFLHTLAEKFGFGFFSRSVNSLENFYRKLIVRLKKLREEMHIAVQAVKNDKQFLWRLILLTVLFYFLTWVNVYIAFKAFNVTVGFSAVCAIVPAIMLVAYLPVTLLGNLGYFESVFVFYFLLVGVGGAESLAMGLLLRLKMLTMGVVGFITYLIYKQKHRLELEQEENTA